MGNSYSLEAEYYYDIEYSCCDRGKQERRTAAQRKGWQEQGGGYFFATAVRCRDCRVR
jgi:hypothetical protein